MKVLVPILLIIYLYWMFTSIAWFVLTMFEGIYVYYPCVRYFYFLSDETKTIIKYTYLLLAPITAIPSLLLFVLYFGFYIIKEKIEDCYDKIKNDRVHC